MKHATLLLALMCLALFISPAFAADNDIPWYLPFFSKNQHLYICGPVKEYGLTQQQVTELERDLDHLSCVCDTNLYFSISCSSDPDPKTRIAYTNLLLERWARNELPTDKRAVIALLKNPAVSGTYFWTAWNYNMPDNYGFFWTKDKDNSTQLKTSVNQYLNGKPYLYAFISYTTLAVEDCANTHISADELAKGESRWQQHLQAEKQAKLKAEAEQRARAEDAQASQAHAAALSPTKTTEHHLTQGEQNFLTFFLSLLAAALVGIVAFVIRLKRKRDW